MKEDEKTPLCSNIREKALQDEPQISKFRHVGYALGATGISILNTFVVVYLPTFLLEIAKIEPKFASMILLFGKSLDAFSDPFVGYLVSRSPDTRLGKFSPWILTAIPFYSLFNLLIWTVPDVSQSYKVVYYFIIYCLINISHACFVIPYNSCVLAMSSCQKQRDFFVACRITCNIFGQVLAMGLFAAFEYISMANNWDEKVPYFFTGVAGAALMLCLGSVALLSIKERFILISGQRDWWPSCQSFWHLLKFKPYFTYMIAVIFENQAFQVVVSMYPLFFKYVYHTETLFPICSIVVSISTGISIFAWRRVSIAAGKKTCFMLTLLFMIIIYWLHLFLQYNLIIIIIIAILLGGFVSCSLFFIPGSMMPDVISAYSLNYGYGEEAKFYSVQFFLEGISAAIWTSMATLVLQATGYNSDYDQQPASVILALRLIVGAFTVVCCLVSFISISQYPITEKYRAEMQSAIKVSIDVLSKTKTVCDKQVFADNIKLP